jgi:hypothetical protein
MQNRILTSVWSFAVAVMLLWFASCGKDECKDVVCQNGGTCEDGVCNCVNKFHGERCELEPCYNVVCLNDGVCENGDCECSAGYEGSDCSIESREKFLGNYLVDGTYACTPGGITEQQGYPVFIQAGSSVSVVSMNLGGTIPLVATANAEGLTIPDQMVNGLSFSGTATTLNDTLSFIITQVDTSDNEICIYTFSGGKF